MYVSVVCTYAYRYACTFIFVKTPHKNSNIKISICAYTYIYMYVHLCMYSGSQFIIIKIWRVAWNTLLVTNTTLKQNTEVFMLSRIGRHIHVRWTISADVLVQKKISKTFLTNAIIDYIYIIYIYAYNACNYAYKDMFVHV